MSNPNWSYHRRLVKFEFKQSRAEGRDPAALDKIERKFQDGAGADRHKLEEIWEEIQAVPIRSDFPFKEPNELEKIRALRAAGPSLRQPTFSSEELYDRLYGAWLGRCAGCALGKPVEVCTAVAEDDPMSGQQKIKKYLQLTGPNEYPLTDYIYEHDKLPEDPLQLICAESTRQKIAYMQEDDDIRYTIIGQMVLQECGPRFSSGHVARIWMRHLPIQWVCSAEATTYRNLAWRYAVHCGEWPRITIDWDWVATYQNPYREWIGAQIRADSWAYAVPGDPQLAAEFAWRDARISHVKNGIYGEMFIAAMIAASFVTDKPIEIVEAGLGQIPKTSRLHADIRKTIDICAKYKNDANQFEPALHEVNETFRAYGTVHANPNSALCAASVLLGGGDFEKTITIAVMAGLDTDCNGATVGSVVGAINGAKRIPKKWTDPLHDTIKGQMIDYHPIAISELARRSVKIVETLDKSATGEAPIHSLREDLILD